MKEIKCWFCVRESQWLCDGDGCDRPLCNYHAINLSRMHVSCRPRSQSFWATTDVCPDCFATNNHRILDEIKMPTINNVKRHLRIARSLFHCQQIKKKFGEELVKKAWRELSEEQRLRIKKSVSQNTTKTSQPDKIETDRQFLRRIACQYLLKKKLRPAS